MNEKIKKIICDCSGLLCPLPILKLQQKWRMMEKNQIVCCITTDPQAPKDIAVFIDEKQAILVHHEQKYSKDYFDIKKIL